jgi:hypothetical protein
VAVRLLITFQAIVSVRVSDGTMKYVVMISTNYKNIEVENLTVAPPHLGRIQNVSGEDFAILKDQNIGHFLIFKIRIA